MLLTGVKEKVCPVPFNGFALVPEGAVTTQLYVAPLGQASKFNAVSLH
jgi:hypothetical protein